MKALIKALIISLMLSIAAPGTRTEIGLIVSPGAIQTSDRNLWNVTTNFEPGTFVVVGFDTNGTETIYDDKVISVREIK